LWAATLLVLFCPAARCVTLWHYGLNDEARRALHWWSHLRMESLFCGVLISYIHVFSPHVFDRIAARRGLLLVMGSAAVAPMMLIEFESPFVLTVGFTLLHLGYGAILIALIATPMNSQWWPLKVVAFIGLFSYPIYLWQTFFTGYAIAALSRSGSLGTYSASSVPWCVGMLLYIVFATLSGILMSVVVERPVLFLRDRFYPARARITDSVDARSTFGSSGLRTLE
jgi:hypothetical protein